MGKPETGEFPPKGRAATGPGRQRRRGRRTMTRLSIWPLEGASFPSLRGGHSAPEGRPSKDGLCRRGNPGASRDSRIASPSARNDGEGQACVAVVAPVAPVHARIGENRRGPLHPGGASLGSRPNSPVTAKPPDDTKAKLHARRTASAERRDRAVHRAAEEASLTRLQQRAASPN